MDNRILFMVFNGEVKFIQNTEMDHREWYISLGGNMEEYDNVIRGYIMDGMMIFFKANLNYDTEVIDFATKMGLKMRNMLNQPELKICCGINPGHDGVKWEPILTLNDTDLEGFKTEEQLEAEAKEQEKLQKQAEQEMVPVEPILEFKNDTDDPEFIKNATSFTTILIVAAIVVKVIMILTKKLLMGNRWNVILVVGQIGAFLLTIVGYKKKMPQTKYFALAASVASCFMFDLGDIIIGALNFMFTIDHTYINGLMEFIKKTVKVIKDFIKSKTGKK